MKSRAKSFKKRAIFQPHKNRYRERVTLAFPQPRSPNLWTKNQTPSFRWKAPLREPFHASQVFF
ncbi:hypothetical protein ACUT03_004725, partial [Salmonella enterica subsp. enterica serovar Newport]